LPFAGKAEKSNVELRAALQQPVVVVFNYLVKGRDQYCNAQFGRNIRSESAKGMGSVTGVTGQLEGRGNRRRR
jgi:hypothetical protein